MSMGVDGFKFDAGDARFYTGGGGFIRRQDITPNEHTQFFAEFGLNYPLNEYRASWKMAGLPLAQRGYVIKGMSGRIWLNRFRIKCRRV